VSDGRDTGYPGRGWEFNRDKWATRSQAARRLAVGAVSARRSCTPVLAAAWDELEPLLNEADQRNLPRDRDLWWRLSVAIRRTIDEAEADEEFQLADVLTELVAAAGLFGMGALREEGKHRPRK
jgi:hypothetical protein